MTFQIGEPISTANPLPITIAGQTPAPIAYLEEKYLPSKVGEPISDTNPLPVKIIGSLGVGLAADSSTFLASVAQGALIANLLDPYGTGAGFSSVGGVPSQLALNGSTVRKGAGAAVPQTDYSMVVRAAKGDRAIEERLTFTALGDQQPAPTYSLGGGVIQAEGNSGSTNFVFTVTRTGDISKIGSVSWAVTGTGAIPANAADFVGNALPSGTTSFGVNESAKTITVAVAGDTSIETGEEFTVTISNVVGGGQIGTASTTGTISNDDVASFISAANTLGDIGYVTPVAVQPITNIGDNITIPSNGYLLRVDFTQNPGAIDFTKVTVTGFRPGHEDDGAANPAKWPFTAVGNAILRQPGTRDTFDMVPDVVSPAQGSGPWSVYIVLDNQIMEADATLQVTFQAGFYAGSPEVIVTPTRFDTKQYPDCIVDFVSQPFRRMGSDNSISVEVTGLHEYARDGRVFARVEGWARVGGVDGPVSGTSAMPLSPETPANGPSKLRISSCQFNVSGGALADGLGGIRVRAYPLVGNKIWESWVIGEAFPTANVFAELPFYKDVADSRSPIYAWVNQDGTGILGSNAAAKDSIRTDLTDPGPAGSFASEYDAARAATSYNGDAAKRGAGKTHADTDGLVIMYRDVAGSTLGSNVGAYSIRNAMGGASVTFGILPVEVRAASGVTSDLVRLRSVKPDGTAASKSPLQRMVWRNITFDTTGLASAAENIVLAGGTGGGDPSAFAPSINLSIFVDCKVRSRTGQGASSTLYQTGIRYDYRMDAKDDNTSTFAMGGIYSAKVAHMALSVGSVYDNMSIHPGKTWLGCWMKTMGLIGNPNRGNYPTNVKPPPTRMKQRLYISFRADQAGGSSAIMAEGGDQDMVGMCNVLVRRSGTSLSAVIGVFNDSVTSRPRVVTGQYISVDAEAAASARINWDYNDVGPLGAVREHMSLSRSAMYEFNSKDDTFFESTHKPSGASVWNSSWPYLFADQVHDSNADLNLRKYYVCLVEHTASADQAADLADPSKWLLICTGATAAAIEFDVQPKRVGNWRTQYHVRDHFCAWFQRNGGGSTFGRGNNWNGEARGRGQKLGVTYTDFYVRRTGGTAGSGHTDWGDQTPKETGPLVDMIPQGGAAYPTDIYGNPRLNNGSGAAGAVERGNIIVLV